jgi:hypothetical protein
VRSAPAIVLAAAFLAAPRPARANMAKMVLDGERYGTIVPDGATAVRVDREALSFVIGAGLGTATVTAAYQLTNTGAAAEGADVAFAFVRGERGDHDPAAHASIEADGAPLELRAMTDAALLDPKLRAWLEAHPEVDEELRSPDVEVHRGRLRALVADAGGRCDFDCGRLLAWHRSVTGDDEHRLSTTAEDEALLGAAREAVPAAADELMARWSTLARERRDARLGFLLFHLDFQPGQTRNVTVHYEHHAEADRSAFVNTLYGFDYLLSPARRWAGFGTLDVSVRVPKNVQFRSGPMRFRDEGDTRRLTLRGLPDGEMHFDVMSLDGLWLGMTEPGGYWAILIVALAPTAIGVGAAAGRLWAGASRWRRILLHLFAAGPLSAACSLAVLVLLGVVFPRHALGSGYGPLLGVALLIILAVPAGALASAASAARKARRAAAAVLAAE